MEIYTECQVNDEVLQDQDEKETAINIDKISSRLEGDHYGGPTQTGAWTNLA